MPALFSQTQFLNVVGWLLPAVPAKALEDGGGHEVLVDTAEDDSDDEDNEDNGAGTRAPMAVDGARTPFDTLDPAVRRQLETLFSAAMAAVLGASLVGCVPGISWQRRQKRGLHSRDVVSLLLLLAIAAPRRCRCAPRWHCRRSAPSGPADSSRCWS